MLENPALGLMVVLVIPVIMLALGFLCACESEVHVNSGRVGKLGKPGRNIIAGIETDEQKKWKFANIFASKWFIRIALSTILLCCLISKMEIISGLVALVIVIFEVASYFLVLRATNKEMRKH